MGRFAEKTEVTTNRRREEIEATLQRYGADQFLYGWQDNSAVVAFRINGRNVRFVIPLPSREDPAFTSYKQGGRTFRRTESEIDKRYEQAVRQRWAALSLVIKAKLEAAEAGITTLEDEFLAATLLPDGKTAGEWLKPQIAEAYRIGAMPALLPMLPAPKGDTDA